MILETATVTALERDALWVEAVQKSACEACTAQKGCGTAVLSKLSGRISRLRVLKPQHHTEAYSLGQQVTIAIPEDIVVLASICAYLVPLGASLAGLWLLGSSDFLSVIGAVLGLAFGGGLVSIYNAKLRNDPRFNPVLLPADSVQETLSLS
jgi:sigma-E factor negative regulatory protein RseC